VSKKPFVAYRILDDKDNQPHTLFHGLNGSRKLPLDQWLEAKVGPVSDGSGVTTYLSGFHVLNSRKKAKSVLIDTFKKLDERVLVRVYVKDTWPKEHSKHGVTLARFMKIEKKDWQRRTKFQD